MEDSSPTAKKIKIAEERLGDKVIGSLIVRVEVGPENAAFDLHEALLVEKSPFFRAALDGSFEEATTRVVTLPEDDPAVFKRFVEYIYGNDTPCETPTDSTDPERSGYLDIALNVWILADKLGCATLQNNLMQPLVDLHLRCSTCASPRQVKIVYQNTLPQSSLRRYLVEVFTEGRYSGYLKGQKSWHPELMRDICDAYLLFHKELISSGYSTRPRLMVATNFHVSESTQREAEPSPKA